MDNNKLEIFPVCTLNSTTDFRASHFNWRRPLALLIILILFLTIFTLWEHLKSSRAKNNLQANREMLRAVQSKFKAQLGKDKVASLKPKSLIELEGFSGFFEALTTFQVEGVWLNDLAINLSPAVKSKKIELVLSGQAQAAQGAQEFYNILTGIDPYRNYGIQISILTGEMRQLTKRELRLQAAAKGAQIKKEPIAYNFVIRATNKGGS